MGTAIRNATPADVPQILAFIGALAEYERAPDAVVATEEALLRDGFGPGIWTAEKSQAGVEL